MSKDMKDELNCILQELYGVELLEYYDKNLLSGDNKTRSEWRQKRLLNAIFVLKRYNLDDAISEEDI